MSSSNSSVVSDNICNNNGGAAPADGDGITIMLENVNYVVVISPSSSTRRSIIMPTRSRIPPSSPDESTLHLLKDINMVNRQGEMCAIMGASGAGKSTLLDLIAGRKRDGFMCGEILFNGRMCSSSSSSKYSCYPPRDTAYVMQDDVHSPVLTVEETLLFSARLRMGRGTIAQDHMTRVEELIKMLGLENCRHTRIGDHFSKGVSGGERKRVSIAVEIVNMPRLIFLDEPTTGLDSETALQVMLAVDKLTDNNKNIISTIHQPSPEVFSLFDNVLLLSEGRMVYFGPVSALQPYLTSPGLNYVISDKDTSLPDFLLLISGEAVCASDAEQPRSAEELEQCFRDSSLWLDLMTAQQQEQRKDGTGGGEGGGLENVVVGGMSEGEDEGMRREEGGLSVVVCRSVMILSHRLVLEAFRGGGVVAPVMGTNVAYAIVMLLIFHSLTDDELGVYNRFSCLHMLILVALTTSHLSMPLVFTKQEQYLRERNAGVYGPLAYLVSSALVQAILLAFVTVVVGNIIYWGAGFRLTADAFVFFLTVLWASAFLSFLMGQWFATWSPSLPVAMIMFPAFLSIFNNLSGFGTRLQNLPQMWAWLADLGFSRWMFQAVCLNEFSFDGTLAGHSADYHLAEFSFNGGDRWTALLYGSLYFTFVPVLIYIGFSPRPSQLHVVEGGRSSHLIAVATDRFSEPSLQPRCLRWLCGRAPTSVVMEEEEQSSRADDGLDAQQQQEQHEENSPTTTCDNNQAAAGGEQRWDNNRDLDLEAGEGSKQVLGTAEDDVVVAVQENPGEEVGNEVARHLGLPIGHGMEVIVQALNCSIPMPDGGTYNYAVGRQKNNSRMKGEKEAHHVKTILNNVNFRIPAGNLCAIMGASGSGKTTLLDVVAGRSKIVTHHNRNCGITGRILFGGRPRPLEFNRISAYVMQDDHHIPVFTVRETLRYAARLRMQEAEAKQEGFVEARVESLLVDLGLQSCAETVVGDGLHRGISGGERKRLSIGAEVVGLPDLILLDEPTSGLDAKIALEVMQAVRRLVLSQRTVLTTIHQPSKAIVSLFDCLLLLARGRVIYFGPMANAVSFFTSEPYRLPFEEGINPANFALQVACGKLAPNSQFGSAAGGDEQQPFTVDELGDMFMHQNPGYTPEEADSGGDAGQNLLRGVAASSSSPRSTWSQFVVLAQRSNHLVLKDRTALVASLGRSILMGLMHGSLNWQELLNTDTKIRDRIAMLYMTFTFTMLSLAGVTIARTFSNRQVFLRERIAGACSTAPFFYAQWIQVLWQVPFHIIYAVIRFLLTHGEWTWDQFGFYVLVNAVIVFSLVPMCQACVSTTRSQPAAMGVVTVLAIFNFMFSGYVVQLPTLSRSVSWIPNVITLRWAIQALVHNELGDDANVVGGGSSTAKDWYEMYGYDSADQWSCLLYIVFTAAAFRLWTYLGLKYC